MQNYTIFNKTSKVLITKNINTDKLPLDNKIILCNKNTIDSVDFDAIFDNTSIKETLLIAEDLTEESLFDIAVKNLYKVKAAGGIVRNERRDFLFMFRNGYWDLPKGHWEEGETIEQTAKREVMEECSVKDLEQRELLFKSYHTYIMNNRREIKETYWYDMFCLSTQRLYPQQEEGVEKLQWVSIKELPEILQKSYPNIRYMFENIYPNLL